uniref:Mas-related G-protein coupled receptor member H-like n=1 Tax=Geotrypetes seraphini TaxID=260995 RepID=A0A6P8NLP2_GEOSA|nr:mas-related G-protein coupled receptor member H-like [Geotrypetes seraphini]
MVTTVNPDNFSENKTSYLIVFFIECVVIPIIIFFGLVGNGIVLWFLGFKIKRNKFAIYILNLATADFLFLLSLSVPLLLYYLENLVFSSKVSKHVLIASLFLYLFSYNTSQYFLTAISVERCLSILYPIWYHCHRPKHLSTVLCALLWALAFLLAGTEYFICMNKLYLLKYPEIQTYGCHAISIFTFLLTFMVFTPIMVISSLTLVRKVQSCSLRRQPPKLYIIIVVTVTLFLICSIPFRIILFVKNYFADSPSEIFVSCCILLSTVSSSINPFVYFYLGNRRRQRSAQFFKEILQRIFTDDTES